MEYLTYILSRETATASTHVCQRPCTTLKVSTIPLKERMMEHMLNNKEQYECLIDGNFEEHISKKSKTNGSTDSWATDAEVYAAATLYNSEILVRRENKSMANIPTAWSN